MLEIGYSNVTYFFNYFDNWTIMFYNGVMFFKER